MFLFFPPVSCKILFLDSSMKYFSCSVSWLLPESFCFSNDCWRTKAINQIRAMVVWILNRPPEKFDRWQVVSSSLQRGLEKDWLLKPRACHDRVFQAGKYYRVAQIRSSITSLRSYWRRRLPAVTSVMLVLPVATHPATQLSLTMCDSLWFRIVWKF